MRPLVRRQRSDDGVSLLEYVLLVALVAMVSVGTLVYLGRDSRSPAHTARSVGLAEDRGSAVVGTATGTPVKAWCHSGETGCSDPMYVGQTDVIHFTASGGDPPYSFTLQGIQPFMTLDTSDITISPTECAQAGTYNLSLLVTDSATPVQHTGSLTFSVTIRCQ